MSMTIPRHDVARDFAVQPKSVTILGCTGSVGRNTIDLIARDRDAYEIVALTAFNNVEELIAQARALRPRLAVIGAQAHFAALKEGLAGTRIEVAAGAEAVVEAATRPAEWVMAAIVGAAGLKSTLAAIRRGAVVAFANKECLVCAGALMTREVAAHRATLLPVDSEHNAIFQVFDFDRPETVERIILTASGGPFRTHSLQAMAQATPEEAVAHPNWDMGAKISVDSATMMNKGLELIEAHHLFALPETAIEILVHPESVIHSMVGYEDGSVLAQLGTPDMRTPIAYSLAWPQRMAAPAARLDFAKLARLSFEAPDAERFPALSLAREALRTGGTAPAILNAANEIAVTGFLRRRIGFLDITRVVEKTLSRLPAEALNSLDEVFEVDSRARILAEEMLEKVE